MSEQPDLDRPTRDARPAGGASDRLTVGPADAFAPHPVGPPTAARPTGDAPPPASDPAEVEAARITEANLSLGDQPSERQ